MAVKQRLDTPTNTFATLNPLDKGIQVVLTNGNLHPTWTAAAGDSVRTTISYPKTSKWYVEVLSGNNTTIGLIDSSKPVRPTSGTLYPGSTGFGDGGSYALAPDGRKVSNDVYSTFLSDYSGGSIIKILFDADSGELKFGIDMENSGSLTTAYTIDNSKIWLFAIGYFTNLGSDNVINFGQDPTFNGNKTPSGGTNSDNSYPDKSATGIGGFFYEPPAGALALCTANLPEFTPTVGTDNPEDYFKCVKYTGVATTASDFTVPVGFQSDLIWIKRRDGGNSHSFSDSVRGFDKWLISDFNGAQRNDDDDNSSSARISTVNASGFTVHNNQNSEVNASGGTFISWNWKAGGDSNTFNIDGTGYSSYDNLQSANSSLPASSTSGMITPTGMSVGVKQGFSIIKYSSVNATPKPKKLPHGLGKKPDLIITKCLDTAGTSWIVVQTILDTDLYLNSTAAELEADGTYFDITADADAITFDSTTSTYSNNGTKAYIVYAFTSIPGYSKFDSYVGNGSTTEGPFIYTGFKPALVWIKCQSDATTTHTSWAMYDNARDPNNVMNKVLYANLSYAEGKRGNGTTAATDLDIDFLSNGFKIRTANFIEEINDSGETYIFCCWAEMPQKYSVAR